MRGLVDTATGGGEGDVQLIADVLARGGVVVGHVGDAPVIA